MLTRADHEEVAELVERRELAVVRYWDTEPVDEQAEAMFVTMPAPAGLCDRVVVDLPELEVALTDVGPRWGLDAALAVDDLVAGE